MDRQDIEKRLRALKPEITQKYKVKEIGFFGSYARGEASPESDIDILVEFKNPPSLLSLIRLENELSEILGIKVDLVTMGALKNKRIKTSIKKDLISIL